MLVVLGLATLFVVISIVWPIVAISKEHQRKQNTHSPKSKTVQGALTECMT